MSKAGRSVRAISSTRIWRQSGSINEVAGDSTVRSHRPTGPAFGRPEDRLHPVPISAMDSGLRRDDANGSGTPYSAGQGRGTEVGRHIDLCDCGRITVGPLGLYPPCQAVTPVPVRAPVRSPQRRLACGGTPLGTYRWARRERRLQSPAPATTAVCAPENLLSRKVPPAPKWTMPLPPGSMIKMALGFAGETKSTR